MQPSWFTVPWVQFQSLPGLTGLPAGNPGQVTTLGGSMGPPTAAATAATLAPQPQLNSINGLHAVNGINSLGVNGINSVNGLNLHGINGLNGLNSLGGINGLNSLAAAPGGLVALPGPGTAAAAAQPPPGHPALALHQVLRRPHQPVPPPIAALIRAKKVNL